MPQPAAPAPHLKQRSAELNCLALSLNSAFVAVISLPVPSLLTLATGLGHYSDIVTFAIQPIKLHIRFHLCLKDKAEAN